MTYAKKLMAIIAAGFGLVAMATTASAGDSNGNFQVKLGVTGVLTQDKTTSLELFGPSGAFAADLLAAGNDATTNNTVIPSLTLTYYLNKNLAVELFCCFDKVSVSAHNGPLLTGRGEIAETWIFPPIVTLQYHFDQFGPLRPYLGVGFEYIHYFNEKLGNNGLNGAAGLNIVDVKFKDSWGFALQGGLDYDLGGGWSLGVDVKKVWEDTKITWTAASGHTVVAKHDLDPIFVTANIGYRFNLSDLFGRREAPAPLK